MDEYGQRDTDCLRRPAAGVGVAEPNDAAGISGFSFVGAEPPDAISSWVFQGNSTRQITTVTFDADLPAGTVVWFTAFYFNAKGQSGPGCSPVSAILAGGGMSMAA